METHDSGAKNPTRWRRRRDFATRETLRARTESQKKVAPSADTFVPSARNEGDLRRCSPRCFIVAHLARFMSEENKMNIGKTLAVSAVSSILVGALAACGGADANAVPKAPSTDMAPPAAKDCCKGKNECKGKSGCKTETNATCAAHNECKGKGTACAKPA
jgi:hypothetical protein